MLDMIVRNVNLPNGRKGVDIAINGGKIIEVSTGIQGPAVEEIDGHGNLASPPFVDSHFHMDAALSLGQPRLNQSGTLLEGIALWSELKPQLTVDAIKQRALEMCRWAIARGTLAIRSHVDICDDRLLAVEALLEVRQQMKPYIDLQLVAFPQDGYLRYPGSINNMQRALDKGVDIIGGIPHFERTTNEGSSSIKMLCELAADRGLLVDMHCDETDDPMSRHVETLAHEANRLGLQGRVTGSHLTSMHSMDNDYVSKLMPLMREADLQVVANPLLNITLQARHDSYPKRRGMTRVKELMEAGINVAFGHDCVMDPWYSLGSHNMLEVAHMGLHVGQLTGIEQMNQSFHAVTSNGAKTLQLEGYGLEPGCNADIVILQASNPIEALRLQPERLFVIRRGKVIAKTEPVVTSLFVDGQISHVNFNQNLF